MFLPILERSFKSDYSFVNLVLLFLFDFLTVKIRIHETKSNKNRQK